VPHTVIVDVMLLLMRDGEVLLALRQGTGYADGWWNVPSGKLERGEDAAAAMVREAREEIGISLSRESLALASTVHFKNDDSEGRIGLFFTAREWDGEPVNAEPHKCAKIEWFPLGMLPENTYPYTRAGVDLYRTGGNFAVPGWPAAVAGT
jgi:mutator protein MutT